MQTIQTRSHVGADGLLHLSLPVDARDTDFDVTVIVQRTSESSPVALSHDDWLQLVAETSGAWQGERAT